MIEITGPVEGVTVRSHDDGHIEILAAPKVAEFSMAVLDQTDYRLLVVDAAGNLELAGQVTYRPLRFRQDLSGRLFLLCERVTHGL